MNVKFSQYYGSTGEQNSSNRDKFVERKSNQQRGHQIR